MNTQDDDKTYDPVYGYEQGEQKEESLENNNGMQMDNTNSFVPPVMPESQMQWNQPKKKKHIWKYILTGALSFVLGACICFLVIVTQFTSLYKSNSASDVIEDLQQGSTSSSSKLSYLINIIENYYYKDVDDETLENGIYKGLLESLDDPYSEYYTADEYEDLMVTLTGNYAGIGALLAKNAETGEVAISKVYSGTPAEKAGLQAGDVLIAADDYQAADLDLDEFVSHIRGEAGTDVTLTVQRDGETMEIVATRDNISTPTVEYQMLNDKTGYIEISQFTNSTYEDFVAAMEDLQSQGMTQIVFDLRNNGGGLLDSVVEILDYILPEGTVVYTMDKAGNREDYTSEASTSISMPITVLVNENTASAAEIFTGAIRDFDYGTIIGTNTFGKGIVQSTIPLSDGSAVKLTTESYYTPSGECIHGVGIAPDIELEYEFLGGEDDTYSVDLDNQIQKALEVLDEE